MNGKNYEVLHFGAFSTPHFHLASVSCYVKLNMFNNMRGVPLRRHGLQVSFIARLTSFIFVNYMHHTMLHQLCEPHKTHLTMIYNRELAYLLFATCVVALFCLMKMPEVCTIVSM